MEEFFSILVLVLWILFSVFNKNKKKKQSSGKTVEGSESHTASSQGTRSILEQILMGDQPTPVPIEDFEESTENHYSNQIQDHKEEKREKKNELSDTEIAGKYKFDPSREGSSSSVSEKKGNNLTEDYEEEKGIEFDLRKAVIYSEILNRPYAN
jgi:hypothetical protein